MLQAAIVAGGRGTRMRAVSDGPKALLEVRGRPLIERLLESLKGAGVREVFLCLGYKAEEIRNAVGDGSRWGLTLRVRVEEAPRGTAGAVGDLKELVGRDLLVVYGDLVVDMDFAKLLEFHASHGAAGTVVVRPTDHPEDSDLVRMDPEGNVTAVSRGGAAPGETPWACTAVWVVRRALLDMVPKDRPSDFARDIFPAALARGLKLAAYPLRAGERIQDIGTPERFARHRGQAGAP